jgi:tRNA threonylcarbamoyl adenosine modification protein YeaZ
MTPQYAFDMIDERLYDGGLHHGSTAAPEVHSLLKTHGITAAELDAVVVTGGPGSFTGLRIGLSLAKGLAAGTGTPIVVVPTLDRFAWHLSWTPGLVVPVIDARKKRFYAAVYRFGERLTEDLDLSGGELLRVIADLHRSNGGADGRVEPHGPVGTDGHPDENDRPRRAPGPGRGNGVVLLTGPHAERFHDLFAGAAEAPEAGLLVDPAGRSVPLRGMVALGIAAYREGRLLGASEGPRYLRDSDARLPGRSSSDVS